jgi:hypothetical protein
MGLITEPKEPSDGVEVDATAPVVVSTAVDVVAPAEVVWRVLVDIEQWPAWNRAVASVSIKARVEPGTEFAWKAGPGTIHSTLLQVEQPRFIAWSGRTLGLRALHVFALTAHGEYTSVRTEESYSGLIARLFRVPLRRSLSRALAEGLDDLKREAERSATLIVADPFGVRPTLPCSSGQG